MQSLRRRKTYEEICRSFNEEQKKAFKALMSSEGQALITDALLEDLPSRYQSLGKCFGQGNFISSQEQRIRSSVESLFRDWVYFPRKRAHSLYETTVVNIVSKHYPVINNYLEYNMQRGEVVTTQHIAAAAIKVLHVGSRGGTEAKRLVNQFLLSEKTTIESYFSILY